MKRTFSLAFLIVLAFALAACTPKQSEPQQFSGHSAFNTSVISGGLTEVFYVECSNCSAMIITDHDCIDSETKVVFNGSLQSGYDFSYPEAAGTYTITQGPAGFTCTNSTAFTVIMNDGGTITQLH